ncbi:MAG: hypothetical protein AAFZ17_22295, partial [Cyanobacteria bacterium J06650_10]
MASNTPAVIARDVVFVRTDLTELATVVVGRNFIVVNRLLRYFFGHFFHFTHHSSLITLFYADCQKI